MIFEETPVLIVGGALAGLSAAAFLARLGHRCLVVERRTATSPRPSFPGPTVRTMELLRTLDLERRVRATGTSLSALGTAPTGGVGRVGSVAWVTDSLLDTPVRWDTDPLPPPARADRLSPTGAYACDQEVFEPILLSRARELGADIRFGTDLLDFDQDADGVTALIRDRATGTLCTVRSGYLLAADGSRSPVRHRLAIPARGPGSLGHRISIHFETALTPTLDGRAFSACFLQNLGGCLLPLGPADWRLSLPYHPERGEAPGDFTPERCAALVRAVLGADRHPIELKALSCWELSVLVAERFRCGRVFLVGDAAHVLPPIGGYGGNLAIQDAHNLAWKLDAVLRRTAGPGLLDTYGAERRPLAQLTLAAAASRLPADWAGGAGDWAATGGNLGAVAPAGRSRAVSPAADGDERAPGAARRRSGGADPPGALVPAARGAEALDPDVLALGCRYRSAAVVRESVEQWTAAEPPGDDAFEDPHEPTGRPGTRAPHVPLAADGRRLSTLDLWDRRFVLLAGAKGVAWQRAGALVARELGVELEVHRIARRGGADLLDVDGAWEERYGVQPEGGVLVRPDGFVAWRSRGARDQPERLLHQVLAQLHCRG